MLVHKQLFFLLFLFGGLSTTAVSLNCYQTPPPVKKPQNTYSNVPFKEGEVSTFAVHYGGILVGYGDISVLTPVLHNGEYLRVFEAKTRTASWYKAVFEANDLARGWTRPGDFGVVKFKVEQDEVSASFSRLLQEKWLSFDHKKCQVKETVRKNNESLKNSVFELQGGATSSLGAVFEMRTKPLIVGTTEKILVYSSGKNWWLEGKVLKREPITTPAGTFDTVKLKLQTYVGKELQQKGDVHAWIADKHPNRPLILMTGDIKIGSVTVTLHQYTPDLNAKKPQLNQTQ